MKKYLSGALAITLALVLSSFTSQSSGKKGAFYEEWYFLLLNGDPADPNDYRPIEDQPCDGTSIRICGVWATEDPANTDRPDLRKYHQFIHHDF